MRRTLLVGLCLLCIGWLAPAAAARRPNVVVILADDQGALDAGCYGSQDLETPSMDRLAQSGIRFTQAYAHTVCCPARAMLMTGRYPQRGGLNTWGVGSFPSEVTLAEVLRAAGYRTALLGKWHLGTQPGQVPNSQGFDEFFGIRDGFIDNYVHYYLHGEGRHDLYEGNTEVFRRGEYFPGMIADRALSFIEENRERPFFLYYALNIPHYPEQSLAHWRERYKDLPQPRRSYAAMISTVDEYVGRIVAQLDRLDLLDDTIIVCTSDNGYSAEDYQIKIDNHQSGLPKGYDYGAHGGGGNTGRWIGAKGSFLEGGIRVPAILSYAGRLPKGVTRDQAVTMMDWFPTILELCGVKPPEGVRLDGQSVVPLVKDGSAPSGYDRMYWQWRNAWMVRQGDWKLIVGGRRGIGRPALDEVYLATPFNMCVRGLR